MLLNQKTIYIVIKYGQHGVSGIWLYLFTSNYIVISINMLIQVHTHCLIVFSQPRVKKFNSRRPPAASPGGNIDVEGTLRRNLERSSAQDSKYQYDISVVAFTSYLKPHSFSV